MAESNLKIIIDVLDRSTAKLTDIQNNLKKKLEQPLKEIGAISGIAFTGLASAMAYSTKEAIDAQSEQNRLVQILKTTHNVTEEQIRLLNDQAKALQKVGVVSDGNVSMVQSQLATFDLTVDTLHTLTPAILDYVVAEKGATATTDDFKSMTNGLAQALQGNFASLTKTGFVLDEATKELISNGTEAERASALVDVLNSTYKDFNKNARKTTQGGIAVLTNSFNEMAGTIGDSLLPIFEDILQKIIPVIDGITKWISENPKLATTILLVSTAVAGLLTVVAGVSLALLAINPVVLLITLAIAGLTAGIVWLVMNWEKIKEVVGNTTLAVLDYVSDMVNKVKDFFTSLGETIKGAWEFTWLFLQEFAKNMIGLIIGSIITILDTFIPQWREILSFIGNAMVEVFTALGETMETIWNGIINTIKFVWISIGNWLKPFFVGIATFIKDTWNGVASFFKTLWEGITKTFESAIKGLLKTIQPLLDAINKVIEFGGGATKSVKAGFNKVIETGKKAIGVNDAIIAPNGNIITTHPDDYLIATKNPQSLAGGSTIVITGNTFMGTEDVAEKVGDMIMSKLKLNTAI